MTDDAVRDLFAEVLPDFDRDRVYTTDIRKLYNWYNQLLAAGITEFKEEMGAADAENETPEETAE